MFARPKDWVDIASMIEAGSVDIPDALDWTAELLGDDSPSHRRLEELARSS